MTRRLCALLVAAAFGCVKSSSNAPPASDTGVAEKKFSQRILDKLDAALLETQKKFGANGMRAGLWVTGVGSWEGSVGFADPDAKTPFTSKHHVRIGSVTKTLTVTLLLRMVDDGTIGLDDKISKWVDGVPNGDAITLRHLGAMQSGLASYTFDDDFQKKLFGEPNRVWTPRELVEIAFTLTKAGCPEPQKIACFAPGTSFFYSNTNTVLLGMALEKAGKGTYRDLLKKYVLEPLNMTSTLQPTDGTLPSPFARGWSIQGVPDGAAAQETTSWNPSWGAMVGDIVSTGDDLKIWAKALGTGALLSDASKKARFIAPKDPNGRVYALGVGYNKGWWGHSGELPGYSTMVNYRPDIDATMIVETTTDVREFAGKPEHPANQLADKIVEIAAEEAPLGDYDPADPHL